MLQNTLLLLCALAFPDRQDTFLSHDEYPSMSAERVTGHSFPANGSRPSEPDRLFVSPAVEAEISRVSAKITSPELAKLFENTLPNCLDTTVERNTTSGTTFVITGDIEAMWLRDSTNQVLPYAKKGLLEADTALKSMICGVVHAQVGFVHLDRYANAFNKNNSGAGHQDDKRSTMPKVPDSIKGWMFEGKYELDSLAAVLKLANQYFAATGDKSCFLEGDFSTQFHSAVDIIVDTIKVQQQSTMEEFANPAYTFERNTTVGTDTLINHGRGVPAGSCGLSKSYFRASDDATTLPFNIPANAMAAVELEHMAAIYESMGNESKAADLNALAAQIRVAIRTWGIVQHPRFGPIFAYEVDCFGSALFMDDANIPSLLSLPYLGFLKATDPTYISTRRFVLSDSNPYFFSGSAGEGVGGPHIGSGYIWPMSIIMRAITSVNTTEISECLEAVRSTHNDMYFIHESFNMNNATDFSRPWFSWANSLFGELIVQLADTHPDLLGQTTFM